MYSKIDKKIYCFAVSSNYYCIANNSKFTEIHIGLFYKLAVSQNSTRNYQIYWILSHRLKQKITSRPPDNFSQGSLKCSCLSSTLYLTYVNNMPSIPKAQLAMFTDNTMFLTQNKNAKRAVMQLQHQLNLISNIFPSLAH